MMSSKYQTDKMLKLVTEAFSDKVDKAGRSYIYHLLSVRQFVSMLKDDSLDAIALGHDLLEDTEYTVDDLKKLGISIRVIDGIEALTRVSGESYDEYMHKIYKNRDAMIVKIADLLDNMNILRLHSTSNVDVARCKKYAKYYLELVGRL